MTVVVKNNGLRSLPFHRERLEQFILKYCDSFHYLDLQQYISECIQAIEAKESFVSEQITQLLILKALDRIGIQSDTTHPDWTYVAARLYLQKMYHEAAVNRSYNAEDKYGSFYGLLKTLASDGIYSVDILRDYTKDEIKQASTWIDPDKDLLFTYIGLKTLADRYLTKNYEGGVMELPQERFLIISLFLMAKEDRTKRLELAKEAFWALSHLYMTVATPTLSNAGKSYGQLSSCFIDTVDDSLRGIYDSNTDIATLSKGGGGIGVYLGKIRARGSDIRGFKGVSSGILPWMKQLNNTAVSVDQLGQRQGSIAVYLDIWHKDIEGFLDAKLNNGDERLRTHDLFTGVCLPDLFMKAVRDRQDWYLFDPHEIRDKKGWSLEDFYDERIEGGSFTRRYNDLVDDPSISKQRISAIELMKCILKSQLESGTPYMFYRDTVNRANPNKHKGMIYCSNLCTEILQNMSPTTLINEVIDEHNGNPLLVTIKKPGDFVVCNLSSINLGRAVPAGVLERLIPIQVRMLDNVIDLNNLEVLQAKVTNQRYRAIGLGTFGWHHLLAKKGIAWESDIAVEFADDLYEHINYLAIQASMRLAEEKGSYPYFEGSDWQTGAYFTQRNYDSARWKLLQNQIASFGLRNANIMAIAPNGSTSVICSSTASIDPVFKKLYAEEKKNYKITVTAPELDASTFWFYKSAYDIDQIWSIRQQAARQRHLDQSASFNIYVRNDIKAKDMLYLHMQAWELGLKTTYYVRSTAVSLDECESCSS